MSDSRVLPWWRGRQLRYYYGLLTPPDDTRDTDQTLLQPETCNMPAATGSGSRRGLHHQHHQARTALPVLYRTLGGEGGYSQRGGPIALPYTACIPHGYGFIATMCALSLNRLGVVYGIVRNAPAATQYRTRLRYPTRYCTLTTLLDMLRVEVYTPTPYSTPARAARR